MKLKVSELSTSELDRFVAILERRSPSADFSPSTVHAHGSPLLDREDVMLSPMPASPRDWLAVATDREGSLRGTNRGTYQQGPSQLIAGMRALLSKYVGPEFEAKDVDAAAARRRRRG